MSDDNETTASAESVDGAEAVTASADRSAAAARAGADGAGSKPDGDAEHRPARKVREGVVVSNAMDKTAVIAVIERVRHPKYNKFVLQTKRLYAHDETNDVNVGDKVRVMETRPLSKSKRWRVTDVLERAK
jgi:small subunit ribosomal protein S17